ncbi:hypothetical protein ACIQWZ_22045 [Streptomyces sp. NPDC098077]|uniref:hypothetical protein n=1 Tax=Streptomyces sp. NPDC098077 TaxID=3366093 RepID=UPI003823E2CE
MAVLLCPDHPRVLLHRRWHLIALYAHLDYLDNGREDTQLGGYLPIAIDPTTGTLPLHRLGRGGRLMERDLL